MKQIPKAKKARASLGLQQAWNKALAKVVACIVNPNEMRIQAEAKCALSFLLEEIRNEKGYGCEDELNGTLHRLEKVVDDLWKIAVPDAS